MSESERAQPTAAFSYYSQQRSDATTNTGRRDSIETIDGAAQSRFVSTYHRRPVLSWAITAIVVPLMVFVSYLSSTPHVTLLTDKTTQYFLQDESVYRKTATASLGGSIFNHSKLTVDVSTIRSALVSKYPEIKNVSVSVPIFGQNPVVNIEPYQPSFVLKAAAGSSYVLDATGRALVTADQVSRLNELQLLTVQDKTGVDVRLGERALPSSTVDFARTVTSAFAAKDITISGLTLSSAYELDVQVTGTPYFVKFNTQEDPLQQVGAYIAVRQRLATDKSTVGQYIDVRVPERAYYK